MSSALAATRRAVVQAAQSFGPVVHCQSSALRLEGKVQYFVAVATVS